MLKKFLENNREELTASQQLSKEGNEAIVRRSAKEEYDVLTEVIAEYSEKCRKAHGVFTLEPETRELLKEKSTEYAMVHGTRYSPKIEGFELSDIYDMDMYNRK